MRICKRQHNVSIHGGGAECGAQGGRSGEAIEIKACEGISKGGGRARRSRERPFAPLRFFFFSCSAIGCQATIEIL